MSLCRILLASASAGAKAKFSMPSPYGIDADERHASGVARSGSEERADAVPRRSAHACEPRECPRRALSRPPAPAAHRALVGRPVVKADVVFGHACFPPRGFPA